MPLRLNCDIVYSQVDLEQEQEIKCIATQGRQTHKQWLTNYQIAYSSEGNDWKFYEENDGEVKVIYCNGLECRLFLTVGVEHEVYMALEYGCADVIRPTHQLERRENYRKA